MTVVLVVVFGGNDDVFVVVCLQIQLGKIRNTSQGGFRMTSHTNGSVCSGGGCAREQKIGMLSKQLSC